jgi:hypothetical protein
VFPDPQIAQVVGQDQNMNPVNQPFAVVDNAPGGGPQADQPGIVPGGGNQVPPPPGIAGVGGPLGEAVVAGEQRALNGNVPEAVPEQVANPLGQNLQPPDVLSPGFAANGL